MFTQEELVKFKDDMLAMCNKLDVKVDPRFETMALNSKCVENTMRNHACYMLDELFRRFSDWFIEHPDSPTCKYYIRCRTNSFLGSMKDI